MKKIGIIMSSPSMRGGVPRITKIIFDELIQNYGYEVTLIYNKKSKNINLENMILNAPLVYLSDYEVKNTNLIKKMINKISNYLFKRSNLFKLLFNTFPFTIFHPRVSKTQRLKKLLDEKNFDIVISNTPRFVYELANATKKKNILTLSWEHNDFFGLFDKKHGFHYNDYINFKKCHRKLNTNVILTKAALSEFENHFKGHFTQIYNGVVLPELSLIRKPAQKVKVFGIVSRLDETHKQITHTINAFQNIKDEHIELLIYGQGDKKALNYYETLISKSSNIKILTGIVDKNVIYNSIDCLILTSKHEGFSLSVIEALSYARPVISYDIISVREVLTNKYNSLLVEFNNQHELKDQILELASNEALFQKLCKNAQDSVKHLCVERISNTWHQLFLELAEKRMDK